MHAFRSYIFAARIAYDSGPTRYIPFTQAITDVSLNFILPIYHIGVPVTSVLLRPQLTGTCRPPNADGKTGTGTTRCVFAMLSIFIFRFRISLSLHSSSVKISLNALF